MILRIVGISGVLCYVVSAISWGLEEDKKVEKKSIQRNKSNDSAKEFNIFLYFAYDINMLDVQMKTKCPFATFYGPAVLKDHRLDFIMEVRWWNGALATICKEPGSEVWGILWMIEAKDIAKLDELEGISSGWYHSEMVNVTTKASKIVPATTYVQNLSPKKIYPLENVPQDRQPSLTYINTMILGAVQGGIPSYYIKSLSAVKHNNRTAFMEIINKYLKSKKLNIDTTLYYDS